MRQRMSKIDLRQGDCLELMKDIPDGSVDMVLIDPPYSGNSSKGRPSDTKGARFTDGHIMFDDLSERAFYKFIRPIYAEVYKKLKQGGHFYCFSDWRQLRNMMDEIELSSFNLNNLVVWDKKQIGMGSGYRRREEYIVVASKGIPEPFRSKSTPSILDFPRIHKGKRSHPHEKPLGLLNILIENSTDKRDVVLDCFMGSGSTGVACKNLNRDFIGIELDETYFNIAKERIATNDQL